MPKLYSRGTNVVANQLLPINTLDLFESIAHCVCLVCLSLYSNPPIVSQAPVTTQSSQTSQLPSLTTSTGKLDLANVMKLCGIMDDDDFMDTDETPQPPPPPPPSSSTPYDMPTSLSTSTTPNDIMVTIPYVQNSDMSHNRVSIEDKSQINYRKNSTADTVLIINNNSNNNFL